MNTQNTNINQSAIYNIIKKSISKNEIIWVKYITHNLNSDSNSDIVKYIITSDKNRTVYFLYKYSIKDNKYIKTNHQSNDPTKLEQKYIELEFEPNPRPKSDSKSKPKSDSKSIPKSKSKSNLNSNSNSDLPTNTNTAINNAINTNTSTNTGTRKRGRPKKEKESQSQNQGQNKIQRKGKLF